MEHTIARDDVAEASARRPHSRFLIAVLLQLHGEFTRSCFAITIVGSIVNALYARKSMRIEPASIAHYLPARPMLSSELARDLVESDVGDELCRATYSVASQLQLSIDLSLAYARSGMRLHESLEALSDTWRRLANACFVLEYMIESAITNAGAQNLKPSRVVFGPLLKQIGSGQHPCVDESGVVCLPGWAERRQAARDKQVYIPAVIDYYGQERHIEIFDISPQGVGLVGAGDIAEGDTFTLYVGKLSGIPCTVRWSDDDRCGAKFETPLHRIDLDAILSNSPKNRDTATPKSFTTYRETPSADHMRQSATIMDYIETPNDIIRRMRPASFPTRETLPEPEQQ